MMIGKAQGFTLVELVVTVAILGILVSIAYPAYVQQVQKSRRAAAKSGLMELSMALEREYARFGHYSEPAAGSGGADGNPAPGAGGAFAADVAKVINEYGANYTFVITADNNSFSITATAAGRQAGDTDCATFTVDQTGEKTATDTARCWQ